MPKSASGSSDQVEYLCSVYDPPALKTVEFHVTTLDGQLFAKVVAVGFKNLSTGMAPQAWPDRSAVNEIWCERYLEHAFFSRASCAAAQCVYDARRLTNVAGRRAPTCSPTA